MSRTKHRHLARGLKKDENDESDGLVKCYFKMSNAMKTLVKYKVESNPSKNIQNVVDEAVKTEVQPEIAAIYNPISELKMIVQKVVKRGFILIE